MIPIAKALKIIDREARPLGIERVPLEDAVGRILAEDIVADTDLPPFDRSQMDGYAVLAADTKDCPAALKLVGESAAGRGFHAKLKRGEAVRIMTGAPLPDGADAVQRLEVTEETDAEVTIFEPTEKGRFIVPRGKEVKRGAVVLKKGSTLSAKNISLAAAFGYPRIKVSKRPRVAILSTGSEIVEISKKPKRDQIRNSNSVMLAALCRGIGCDVTMLRPAGDDLDQLRAQISGVIKTVDLLISTGGVSVGRYDLTKPALTALGAEIFFERVALKPGKPTVFAKLKRAHVVALPGNPVSAAVTFHLFVRRLLLLLQGSAGFEPQTATAVAAGELRAAKERDSYLPARLKADTSGRLLALPLRWHGSSDFVGFSEAEALAFVAKGRSIAQGDTVKVTLLT
jgi:molybdopterin molybdotransferase